MKIETKFDVDDMVYFVHETMENGFHIRRGIVRSLSMDNNYKILYKVADVYADTVFGMTREHSEDVLFASPEDVCKYLMSNVVMSPAA